MTPLPAVNLSSNDCDILRKYWASAYGAAVRQRTVRQETTITCIAKQGTLPEFLYQRHLEVSESSNENVDISTDTDKDSDNNSHTLLAGYNHRVNKMNKGHPL